MRLSRACSPPRTASPREEGWEARRCRAGNGGRGAPFSAQRVTRRAHTVGACRVGTAGVIAYPGRRASAALCPLQRGAVGPTLCLTAMEIGNLAPILRGAPCGGGLLHEFRASCGGPRKAAIPAYYSSVPL